MKDYGREFIGNLIIPEVSSLPTFDAIKHSKRLVSFNGNLFIGGQTQWNNMVVDSTSGVSNMNVSEKVFTGADSITINWATCGSALITLNRATTAITMINGVPGQVYRIRLLQDATGGRLITFTNTIKWRGGTSPTLTTTANKADWITLVYSSIGYDADINCNF